MSDQSLRSRFFAVPPGADRDRRPTDVLMLVATSLVLAIFALRADSATQGFEQSISDVITNLPTFLRPLWNIANDGLGVWAIALVVVAAWRRHWGLVRDIAVTVAAVLGTGALVGRLANGVWPDVFDAIIGTDGPVEYPAAGLALWVAIASVASSHLSRPARHFGRWIITLGGVAALALGIATPTGSIGAISLGLAAAAAVHLIFGSPGGMPTLSQVRAALEGIDVEAEPREMVRRSGVVRVRALSPSGEDYDVKVFGRDAWDGQLIVKLWRFMWYRDHGPTLSLTRLQQVEHEAFLTLLAERRGASVNPVVAAGADSIGDALLVVRRIGVPLSDVVGADASVVKAMWSSLAALHSAGINHGGIDADRVFIDGDVVRLADLEGGEVVLTPESIAVDRAQLLVTSATAVGAEQAVALALEELGPQSLADVSSYVQPAALTTRLRQHLDRIDLDVDEIRKLVVGAAGEEKRDLQKLRRLSIGSVLMAAVLLFAATTLITGLLEIGLDTIADSIREANFAIVVLAFCVSLLSRPASATALTALSPTPIPLGRLTILQFAMNFVNVAMPSTAGRVAVNIRFFQRSGINPTTAVAIGALDGFTGFLGQITLLGVILFFGLGSLNLQLEDRFSFDSVGSLLIVLVLILVVAIAVIAFVPKLRDWVLGAVGHIREFVGPLLRSPRRLAKALIANMAAELVGAMTLYTVLVAFGQNVAVPDVILVGIAVGLFSGLMPVPGGIGVAEAALTAGFISIGVDEATAFAAALTCRMVTFYTPPLIGWFALRWLQRRRYL